MIPMTIPTILSQVLGACQAAFAVSGAPTVPSRTFIAHGQPVWEGEQMTVTLGPVLPTHPFPLGQGRAVKSSVVPGVSINIEVVRACWPTAELSQASKSLPDPSEFTTASQILAKDASTLFGYFAEGAAHGNLIAAISTSEDIALGQMVPVGPQGTLAGWRLPITVKVT